MEPGCKLCATDPRSVFPDWDRRIAQLQAGTEESIDPPVVLIEIKSVQAELAGEVLWFINEWCKELGWLNPRMKNGADGASFTISAHPPKAKESAHDDSDT